MVSETLGAGSPSGAPGFQPDAITVVVGINNTISWTNDDVGHNHTVTSVVVPTGATPFDSGNMVKNAVYTVTLTVPGLYRYGCSYHPWMTGIIDVVASKPTGATGLTILGFPLAYLAAILVVVVVVVIVAGTRLRPRPSRPTELLPAAQRAGLLTHTSVVIWASLLTLTTCIDLRSRELQSGIALTQWH